MRTELKRLQRATGATSVYVTHDQIEAMTMATHVVVMNQVRVQQFGTPPNNMIPVVRNGSGYKVADKHMPITTPAAECMAMYRAEALAVSPKETPTGLSLELVEVSAIAGRTMVTALRDDLRLTAIVDGPPTARIGDRVNIDLPREPACWFGPGGERIG